MIDIGEVRDSIRSGKWLLEPFSVFSMVSGIYADNEDAGRDLVIRALEWRGDLDEDHSEILDELAAQVGLYPYVDGLESLSLKSALSHAAHRADGELGEYVLHRAQSRVLQTLLDGKSVILSAPTSFGKSLLIDAVISSKGFQNIVLIVPTLALVEETRRRMARFSDRYSVITASGQSIGENNIFVLTQERYLAMETDMPHVDFFVIDEFYKLSISEEGDRATQLNQAFLSLSRSGAQFYLLGPAIAAVPDVVREKADCCFIYETFQTVAVEQRFLKKKPNKVEALAQLLDEVDGQTLVYCQSPPSTRKLLKEYLSIRDLPITDDAELLEAVQWTASNYHESWMVSVALRHGIGIHHGRLPRSLARFMVRAFEEGKLKVLLCTSTLIEGVNTAAKNVVIYDGKLNQKPLDFFTFNNIRGRSGRMFRHFVGNVFVFDNPPEPELPFVDIPAFNPGPDTPSSLLLQMREDEIPPGLSAKVKGLLGQGYVSAEVLRKNRGIEPEFLIETGAEISGFDIGKLQLLSWSAMPTYESLELISELIWGSLRGSAAARQSAILSPRMMTFWIWRLYVLRNVSHFRRDMIASQIGNPKRQIEPDEAVESVLAFLRGWASFNYPKYLMALSDVANEVLGKRGMHGCNYSAFAAMIEHLFQPSSFSSLEEFGLPNEISQRLVEGRVFGKEDSLDVIISSLKKGKLDAYANGLFEKKLIEDFQVGIGAKAS